MNVYRVLVYNPVTGLTTPYYVATDDYEKAEYQIAEELCCYQQGPIGFHNDIHVVTEATILDRDRATCALCGRISLRSRSGCPYCDGPWREGNPTDFLGRYLMLARKRRSVLCVGLDPTPEHVPPQFGTGINAMREYLFNVIQIAADRVAVIKPQIAYYEEMGPEGMYLLKEVIDAAHGNGLLVILDAKRADIGSTMEAYGRNLFGYFEADAATVNSQYFGDVLSGVWNNWFAKGKMAIMMILTSNPEATSVQNLKLGGMLIGWIWEQIAIQAFCCDCEVFVESGNRLGRVGGVVGATKPEDAKLARAIVDNDFFFLVPGFGMQGAGAEDAVAGFPSDRIPRATVNSSRAITLTSWFNKDTGEPRPGDPLELVATAIDQSNLALNAALSNKWQADDPFSYELE